MPRTAVTVTTLTPNAGIAAPATTAIDPTNGHYVASPGPLEELFLIIGATFAGSKNYTIKGGDNPPADRSQDVVLAINNTTRWVGPFTSAQFVQSGAESGQLHVDVEAGATGTIAAVYVPRTA